MTTYFKTNKAMEAIANLHKDTGNIAEKCSLNCDCGESVGYRIINSESTTIEKLILCANCYENAPNKEKGE